jgi:hypothetical protein
MLLYTEKYVFHELILFSLSYTFQLVNGLRFSHCNMSLVCFAMNSKKLQRYIFIQLYNFLNILEYKDPTFPLCLWNTVQTNYFGVRLISASKY